MENASCTSLPCFTSCFNATSLFLMYFWGATLNLNGILKTYIKSYILILRIWNLPLYPSIFSKLPKCLPILARLPKHLYVDDDIKVPSLWTFICWVLHQFWEHFSLSSHIYLFQCRHQMFWYLEWDILVLYKLKQYFGNLKKHGKCIF